jgi:hypothetical protein
MGTSLSGLLPQDTYQGLIKVGDNTAITSTLKTLSDGAGNNLPIQVSSSALSFNAQSSFYSVQSAGTGSDFFYSDINPNLTAGANNQVVSLMRLRDRGVSNTGGFTGTQRLSLIMENAGGSSFPFQLFSESGALRIGHSSVATPTALVHLKGTGSTAATTSLLVQNSAGVQALKVEDGGVVQIGLSNFITWTFNSNSLTSSNYAFILSSNGSILSTSGSGGVHGNDNGGKVSDSGISVAQVASAVLEVSSTTKGFLPPRMTNAQRAAIASPAEGLILFNTDNKGVAYRDGTNWGYLSGAKQTVAASGGTVAVSFASGNIIDMTLTASTTLTFAGHVVGTYIFELIQGGSGSYTITWPASVKWSGGTAPTLTTTVGKTDIVTLFHDGTNFFGTYSLNY